MHNSGLKFTSASVFNIESLPTISRCVRFAYIFKLQKIQEEHSVDLFPGLSASLVRITVKSYPFMTMHLCS